MGLAETAGPGGAAGRAAGAASRAGPQIQLAQDGPYLVTNARDSRLARPAAAGAAADGAVPLRRLGDQAVLRRHPRQERLHRRQGSRPGAGPARHLRRPAGDHPRQPRHLPALGVLHRPARDACSTPARSRSSRPSGGRMDEIIRAVRDCPSGALSYAIDGVEARDQVDYHGTRAPAIEVTKDGPYRVTGGIPLADGRGRGRAAQRRAPPASTTRCAAAASRRTSRSAAACTGTSTSRTRCRTRTRADRCSNGPAACRR